MERNILDVQFEIQAWELKRNTLRRELAAGAGNMSDIMLAGYRTAIADCEARIAELREELSEGYGGTAEASEAINAVPVSPWGEFFRVFSGRKVTDVQCEIL